MPQVNLRSATTKGLAILFASLAIIGRIGYFISTPLWLDHFSNNDTASNHTHNDTSEPHHTVSVFFLLITQWSITTLTFGAVLLAFMLFTPHTIGAAEKAFPIKFFLIIGVSQGVSSVLFNFSVSGSRTAPYLQAILSNCNIPIQFTLRFLLLKKRPTRIKLLCALAVVVAEFMCLIPSIFPGLEGKTDHDKDGGSTGVGRFIWPLFLVGSMVPFAIANTTMERSIKKKEVSTQGTTDPQQTKPGDINLVYFLFMWSLVVTATVGLLFWTDLIPEFGTSKSFSDFAKNFAFDIQCIFGGAGCDPGTSFLGWTNYFFNIIGCISFAGLMRYSEGANFAIIVLALRTPLLFLFWTLFTENPFYFNPHVDLSTWLSIAGILIMLPAIIIYDLSAKEIDHAEVTRSQRAEDEQSLIINTDNVPYSDDQSDNPRTSAQHF